jgi:short-subunit dehydrogenase
MQARPVIERTAIVVGASSGLGRALAEGLARAQWSLLLVASDPRDLDAVANDLHLRFGVAVRALALDLGREPDPGARVLAALDGLPPPGALLVAAGVSREDDDLSLAPPAVGQLLAVNLHAPLVLVNALLPRLVEARATIVLIGSIAAARGRGRNVAYAAAKRGLESLYESLRQCFPPKELSVQLYRLGFLRSNLTWGTNLPLPAADPETVARRIVRDLGRGSRARHLPWWWALVALALRWLPWPLFRRVRG